jgi:hypothetical protein
VLTHSYLQRAATGTGGLKTINDGSSTADSNELRAKVPFPLLLPFSLLFTLLAVSGQVIVLNYSFLFEWH